MLFGVMSKYIPLLTAGVLVDRHLRRNPPVTVHSIGLIRRVRSESNKCPVEVFGVNLPIAISLVPDVHSELFARNHSVPPCKMSEPSEKD
jgi:hypothetical protein